MSEDEKSKETRLMVLGLIALAVFAALFIGIAIGLGEFVEMPKR